MTKRRATHFDCVPVQLLVDLYETQDEAQPTAVKRNNAALLKLFEANRELLDPGLYPWDEKGDPKLPDWAS